MKKFLIFVIIMLGHFSINAEGINLNCSPSLPLCDNCPEYQTLFPLEQFSENSQKLDIEADESEILEKKYLLSGNVEVNSENLYLSANNVEVSPADSSLLAKGNVKFQDSSYLISSDSLAASRKDDELIATATNANYQDYSSGLGGANGFTEVIEKTPTSVLLTNSTYSLCPINENDWLIDADQIILNLEKNRGVADNATVKFYGVPIFYTPKYSWVLSGRGSGFLTPDYSSYNETGHSGNFYSLRIPYYFNLAPDRDLLVAMTFMSSRRLVFEGKYRQLITPKNSKAIKKSMYSIETKYLPEDKITGLKRWLFNFSEEFAIDDKAHLTATYYRVSDKKFFEEIARTNTNIESLKSFIKYSYEDKGNNLALSVLTENEQVVNSGAPSYTKALEGSISKTIILGKEKISSYDNVKNKLNLSYEDQVIYELDNPKPEVTNLDLNIVSTKFSHATATKESGTRSHGKLGISRKLKIRYPRITPSASISITNYSLKNTPDINRTILGSGLNIDFTYVNKSNLFGYEVNHKVSPVITYNYRAKKVQGNIPLFDSTDKYDDIISFSDLTSGERYTGLDRITNANDITLSLSSSYRLVDSLENDQDLLSMRIAQTYFTDDEVVSDSADTNYETRKSYSDIAASISLSIDKFSLNSAAQFNPSNYKIIKKENTIKYSPSSRKFISLKFIDEGTKETESYYGAFPLTDAVHIFGGLDKTTSTGTVNAETAGIAYESCCWAFRIAHFKEDKSSGGYNYSTGMELVLTGLGSTSSPLKDQIENKVPGYKANLR
jgi:LPS-assembly protein